MDCKNDHSTEKQLSDQANVEDMRLEAYENDGTKRILEDTKEEITHLYQEYQTWLKDNMHSIEKHERVEKLKMDLAHLRIATKRKLYEFHTRSDVQLGKRKAVALTSKLADTLCYGIAEIKNSEVVHKVYDSMHETFVCVKEDERVKHNVKKFKRGTLKVAESAFNGLKRVLDTDDENQKG